MTIRNYKKAYWVGRDSYGKMIYDGDTVEVWLPWETGTPHQSQEWSIGSRRQMSSSWRALTP